MTTTAPSADRAALLALDKQRSVKPAWMPDWQWARVQELIRMDTPERIGEQSRAQLDYDRRLLEKAVIHAPINGIVLKRQVEPGQTVAATLQTPVLFTLAESLSQMLLNVQVDEADVGQVKAVLADMASGIPVIDLLHDAPPFNAHAGAHLLAALAQPFPRGSVFFAVVDPGVGTPRGAVAVEADGRWFVGPDNGLLSVLAQRAAEARVFRIAWQPDTLSSTFHGRDLFEVFGQPARFEGGNRVH